ncbi:ubiquitin fusion degradation-like protein [Cryptosporidium canis]|uniref:Ubiquitin fusion degradation-like protein n=1 Tax=Cryptosporidium canis TaxID=195482 RepID=A0ABQ8PBQ6_9CRYT|nr:ubiquitin fusion degradation-like protein [Cryptosporidium canis]
MDDFSSSLARLRKEQERERKRLLDRRSREKRPPEKGTYQVQDYLSSIERRFIRQQASIQSEVSQDEYRAVPSGESSYSWILKLNLSGDQAAKFPNSGETDKVILPTDLLRILSKDESLYPLYFGIKCLNGYSEHEKGHSNKDSPETHCGVLDYSEQSGFISLPNKVLRCLNISPELHLGGPNQQTIWIQIEYKKLPKGSMASFEVLSHPDIFKMHDIESLLETYLRNHFLTLTVGDTLMINQPNYSNSNYCISVIRVQHLEPDNSVSLINTDLSIDITYKDKGLRDPAHDPPSQLNDQPNQLLCYESNNVDNSINSLNIGETFQLDDQQDAMYFKLEVPYNLKKVLLGTENSENVAQLVISVHSDHYFDIFVSFPPIFEASSHLYIFRSFPDDLREGSSGGGKSLVISPADFTSYLRTLDSDPSGSSSLLAIFPSILFITIQRLEHKPTEPGHLPKEGSSAAQGPSSIKVSIQYCREQDDSVRPSADRDCSVCSNCRRRIPTHNLDLHSIQCERMYTFCDQCGLVLKKKDLEKHTHCEKCPRLGLSLDQVEHHEKLYHQFTKCKLCGQDNIQPIQLRVHQTQECPKRIILCRFCNNFVQAGTDGHYVDFKDKYYYNLTSHESYCGSRTTNCHLCNKVVLIKELKSHIELVHHPS